VYDVDVERERRLNGGRDVAVVGLRDPEGRVLMVQTRRFPSRWQPIGGGIDPGDSGPVATLVRELGEEAGLELGADAFRQVQAGAAGR